jgi:2',3'-cyclic-nucleotide 2'-phosphodiesterase (5'-nucleotidase family)
MNKVEFNVSIIGNHEFDYGVEQLLKLDKGLKNNYICANFCYNKNKSTIFEPYKILEVEDKKIAFIGIVTPYTFYKSSLSKIKDEKGEPIYDLLIENNGQKLYETVQNYINEVRSKKGANYVILLAHFGLNGTEGYTSDKLLKNLEGVDAVLDGHTHLVYNTTTKDKKNKDIHITQTGTKLQNIGILILKKDNSIISEKYKRSSSSRR